MLANPDAVLEMREVQAAARHRPSASKSRATRSSTSKKTSLPPFAALKAQADALYVVGDALVNANRHPHHYACARRAVGDDLR